MRKSLGLVLFAALLVCAGCVTTAPPDGISLPPAPAAKWYPPVTPEQAAGGNPHQTAQALQEEMDREQQQILLTTQR